MHGSRLTDERMPTTPRQADATPVAEVAKNHRL
jgi:hypothetical protein